MKAALLKVVTLVWCVFKCVSTTGVIKEGGLNKDNVVFTSPQQAETNPFRFTNCCQITDS